MERSAGAHCKKSDSIQRRQVGRFSGAYGLFIVAGLILTMNYNHPYTFMAQKAVVSVPVIAQVSGIVSEVPVQPNVPIKAGEVLFRIDPTVYQARVDRLSADLVSAEAAVASQRDQLTASKATVAQMRADRDRAQKDLARYQRAAGKAVNPFTEQEATNARQTYLAQEAKLASAEAQAQQIQSQLDALVSGENAGIVSLKAQLREAKYNLAQTEVKALTDGYVTQVLLRPGSFVNSMPFRPAMFFIPQQSRNILASSARTLCCASRSGMKPRWCLTVSRGKFSRHGSSRCCRSFPRGLIRPPM